MPAKKYGGSADRWINLSMMAAAITPSERKRARVFRLFLFDMPSVIMINIYAARDYK